MISRLTFKNVAAFLLAAVLATGATAITVQAGNAAKAAEMGVETPDIIKLLEDDGAATAQEQA
ncbi:MAG: hypothetical protein V4757_15265 [Pseudomonadota bacterium]